MSSCDPKYTRRFFFGAPCFPAEGIERSESTSLNLALPGAVGESRKVLTIRAAIRLKPRAPKQSHAMTGMTMAAVTMSATIDGKTAAPTLPMPAPTTTASWRSCRGRGRRSRPPSQRRGEKKATARMNRLAAIGAPKTPGVRTRPAEERPGRGKSRPTEDGGGDVSSSVKAQVPPTFPKKAARSYLAANSSRLSRVRPASPHAHRLGQGTDLDNHRAPA